jgi:uncharacterized membrane protein
MDFFIVLLLIIIIILIISQKNNTVEHIRNLEHEIHFLKEQLIQFISIKKNTEASSTQVAEQKEQKKDEWKSGFQIVEEPIEKKPIIKPAETEPFVQSNIPKKPIPEFRQTEKKPAIDISIKPHKNIPEAKPQPGFFERHPDLEKFIGENIISKIGIAILVLAIGFFVKYAIDNNWIGPSGRVGIGLLCGGILTALAHVLRKNYKAFSSVLVGGGLAIFYFTIALAYHQYQLFSQTTSFIIMIVITAFAVLLSILYNRQDLAIISLVGGFATPFMVSNGNNDYKTLFIYLIILNTGLLVIAYHKAWRLLNLLAFIFTVILFGGWLFTLAGDVPRLTYYNGFIFATIFYFLFFSINIAHNIKENKKFIASDFGILLANTCLYFSAGLYLLTQMDEIQYRGLFSASMGVFNLVMSFILFRNKKADTNILYLLIGITLTFISLTAPIQLHGHFITLFWASECVLLFWLYQKSKISIIKISALIVWVAMLISLVMDWVNIYGNSSTTISVIFNKGFITTLYAALACYALALLKNKEQNLLGKTTGSAFLKTSFIVSGTILLFAGGAFEINHQFTSHYPEIDLNILYLLLYTYAFALVFTILPAGFKVKAFYSLATGILSGCIIIYLLSVFENFSIQQLMLEKNLYPSHFMAHWISAILMVAVIYKLILFVRLEKIPVQKNSTIITTAFCTVIVVFLSAEVLLIVINFFYSKTNTLDEIRRVYIKTGLPVLWGFCSFACMWLGMHYKFKTLRITGLVLFLITLLKLFLFDIRNIPVAGKIAAFFCLGVLLLVVSFMYQRLKKIIIEDEEKSAS